MSAVCWWRSSNPSNCFFYACCNPMPSSCWWILNNEMIVINNFWHMQYFLSCPCSPWHWISLQPSQPAFSAYHQRVFLLVCVCVCLLAYAIKLATPYCELFVSYAASYRLPVSSTSSLWFPFPTSSSMEKSHARTDIHLRTTRCFLCACLSFLAH